MIPSEKKIEFKRVWVVHCVAECTTCGALFQNYRNAQALAAKHAKATGHLVTGEIGLAFRYGKEGGSA